LENLKHNIVKFEGELRWSR